MISHDTTDQIELSTAPDVMSNTLPAFPNKSAVALLVLGLVAASWGQDTVFTLNANANAYNQNDAVTWVSDPHTTVINTAPGTGSVFSSVSVAGEISASQSISATLLSPTSGSITFDDQWSSNLVLGQVKFWDFSWLEFTTTEAGQFDVYWTSTVASSGDNTIAFGIQDIYMMVDGVNYIPDLVFPAPSAGEWHIAMDAGTHTVGFQDFSNIFGGMGTQTASLHETLTFAMNPVPEPASLAALGLGLGFLVSRVRRTRA